MGAELFGETSHLIQGDFSFSDRGEARHLLAGATSFFHSLKHQYDGDYEEGLQSADAGFQDEWGRENKPVFMFSGCKDEQTSADAFINGRHVGESMLVWQNIGVLVLMMRTCRGYVLGVSGDDEDGCVLEYFICAGEYMSYVESGRTLMCVVLARSCKTQGLFFKKTIPRYLNYHAAFSST